MSFRLRKTPVVWPRATCVVPIRQLCVLYVSAFVGARLFSSIIRQDADTLKTHKENALESATSWRLPRLLISNNKAMALKYLVHIAVIVYTLAAVNHWNSNGKRRYCIFYGDVQVKYVDGIPSGGLWCLLFIIAPLPVWGGFSGGGVQGREHSPVDNNKIRKT